MLVDFNIDLLKSELSDSINNFIDTLSPNFLLPHIYLKTSTLIDNIFSNSTSEEIESGKVTFTFSDHLLQFIVLKDFFLKILAVKSNIYTSKPLH